MNNDSKDITRIMFDIWQRWGIIPWGLLVVFAITMAGLAAMLSIRNAPLVGPPQYQAEALLMLDRPEQAVMLATLGPLLTGTTSGATITAGSEGNGYIVHLKATAAHPDNARSGIEEAVAKIRSTTEQLRRTEMQMALQEYTQFAQGVIDFGMTPPEPRLVDMAAISGAIIGLYNVDVREIPATIPKSTTTRNGGIAFFLTLVVGVVGISAAHTILLVVNKPEPDTPPLSA